MSDAFNWVCPVCGSHTTITNPNFARSVNSVYCHATPEGKAVRLEAMLIECPNRGCNAQSFSVRADHGPLEHSATRSYVRDPLTPVGIGKFTFLPTSAAPLSRHVPSHVASDYNEAYLIATLSPKASATLARRALQGMVRDFFNVTGRKSLHQELQAIKDHCDADLFEAMMAVKSVGNIGAHPDHDASLIVDVDPDEARTLLQLIHLLDREWYVARAERQERVAKMRELGNSKKAVQGVSLASLAASRGLGAPPAAPRLTGKDSTP